MEEMSQPDEEEWESYREDTKELGRCNVSEVKGICTQPGLRACDTLDCQLGSLRTVSGKPLPQWAQTPKPNTRIRQNRVGLKTARGWLKLISGPRRKRENWSKVWLWRWEGTILSFTQFLFLPEEDTLWTGKNWNLVPESMRVKRWDENQQQCTWHLETNPCQEGLWPGPVDGLDKQETAEQRRAAGDSESECVWTMDATNHLLVAWTLTPIKNSLFGRNANPNPRVWTGNIETSSRTCSAEAHVFYLAYIYCNGKNKDGFNFTGDKKDNSLSYPDSFSISFRKLDCKFFLSLVDIWESYKKLSKISGRSAS